MSWVKLHRIIFENDIWKHVIDFRLFLFLVANARYQYEPMNIGKITIARGQFLRSYRKLQDDLLYYENRNLKKYSLSQIQRSVTRLKNCSRIAELGTELGTLFSIINYDKYQANLNENEENQFFGLQEKSNLERILEHNLERTRNNTKNIKNINIIETAKSLIAKITDESSFYAILNKYKGELTEQRLEEILTYCAEHEKQFETVRKLASYLEACSKSNGKNTDGLRPIKEGEPSWM